MRSEIGDEIVLLLVAITVTEFYIYSDFGVRLHLAHGLMTLMRPYGCTLGWASGIPVLSVDSSIVKMSCG